MKTAKNLPAGLAAEVLDALIQLRREGDPKAIDSLLAGLEECPDEMLPLFVPGLLGIAQS